MQITRRRISQGLLIFTLLSFSSLLAIFMLTRSGRATEALQRVNPMLLALALGLVFVDWLGGGYRLYIFTRVLSRKVGFRTCVRANLGNIFMAAVTPAQTGGGPAQIYILYSAGMPAVEATSASLMTFLSTVFFLIIAAAVTFVFQGRAPLPGRLLSHLFNSGILIFLFIGLLVVLALVFPGFYREAASIFFRALSRIRRKNYFAAGNWANRMIDAVDRCHKYLVHFLKREWPTFLLAILVSGVLFFMKFLIAYFLVVGLGIQASLVDVILLQVVIVLINYFFPSPGGSGAAEFSSAALMAAIVSKGILVFYVILWRLLTMYISVAVGGVVMLHELGKKEKLDIENSNNKVVEERRIASFSR